MAIPHDGCHDLRNRLHFCASESCSQVDFRSLLLKKGGELAPFKKQSRGISPTREGASTSVRSSVLHFGISDIFGGCRDSVQLEDWHIGARYFGHCLRDRLSAISKGI